MPTREELLAANPFPGLRAFTAGEADRFFGRQRQIEELTRRLDETPLVAVAGASGCGKSSLVLAGLLHALKHRHELYGGTEWRAVVMRPGNQPIAALAARLSATLTGRASNDDTRAAALEGRLRLGGLGLVEAVRLARLEQQVRVLVVVDQFEEIFRFKRMTNPDEATAFVKLLLHAASDTDSAVSVVLTLRSDTLGYCADFHGLPEAVNRGQYLVPRLTREQRKDAIVRPVELRRAKIAPRLVQRLLNDVSDDFDDLPVMQHVLTRTWWHWAQSCADDRPIDLEDYDAVGGAAEALSNHADEAYGSQDGVLVEKVFRALTEQVAEGTEIRRPLDFERLCAVTGAATDQVAQVIERFRQADTALLLPAAEVPLAANPVIDISHESLIRRWARLREWTREEAEARATLVRLVQAAQSWKRNEGDLWRGRDLERALEWQARVQPNAAWVSVCVGTNDPGVWQAAQRFLAESDAAARREQRRWRLLVWSLRGLALLTVGLSVGAAIVGISLERQARSRELANRALLDINQDPARSAHLALAALDQDPDNSRAEYALRQSLSTLEVAHTERIVELGEPIIDVRYGRDNSRLVVAGEKSARILDARTLKFIGEPIEFEKELLQVWLIANNKLLLGKLVDGAEIRTTDGRLLQRLTCAGEKNTVYSISVSPDEHYVAVGCHNGEVDLWELEEAGVRRLRPLAKWPARGATVTALAFSGDSKYLVSGDFAGAVQVWKVGYQGPWITSTGKGAKGDPIRHLEAIRDVAFHPTDSELLATASDDNSATVWRLDHKHHRLALPERKGSKTRWPLRHDRPVTSVRFAPRGDEYLLLTISDKRVSFWLSEEQRVVRSHDDWVGDANASADGEYMVSASSDGTARVWSTRSGAPIAVLRGHRDDVTRAFFAPRDKEGEEIKQIVTASRDGILRLWRIHPPRLLAYQDGKWVLGAAFDPAGKRVAWCGERSEQQCTVNQPRDLGTQAADGAALSAPNAHMVGRVSWSHDGKWLIGLGNRHSVANRTRPILWEIESRREITPTWLEESLTATFSASTPELLTVKNDGRISLWDADALTQDAPSPKLELPPHPGRWLARLSPDGRWLAALDKNNIAIWPRDNPKARPRTLRGHRGDIKSLEFSSDSRWIVTASVDRTARLWPVDPTGDGQDAKPLVLSGGHTAALASAAFSPDDRLVVTSSADNTVRVWNAKTGYALAALNWHGEAVNQVQFGSDGDILSASDDGTVRLGQCEACTLDIEGLRNRVERYAVLTRQDENELNDEKQATMRWFKLPKFLSGQP